MTTGGPTGPAATSDAEELRLLRSQVRASAHEMCNVLGIALNYLDFLAEDIAGADTGHPIWQKLPPIENAIRRAVETVQGLRNSAVLAEEQVGAQRAEHGQRDRKQDHQ